MKELVELRIYIDKKLDSRLLLRWKLLQAAEVCVLVFDDVDQTVWSRPTEWSSN